MSKLKQEIKIIRHVDAYDLGDFITEFYGHTFEVPCDLESSNDTSHEFYIEKKPLDEYNQRNVDKYIETGKGVYMTRELMLDMCNKGAIEPGLYIVRVSW